MSAQIYTTPEMERWRPISDLVPVDGAKLALIFLMCVAVDEGVLEEGLCGWAWPNLILFSRIALLMSR